MIDLKKIITQIDNATFTALENDFTKNKAENSLYLLKAYKNGNPKDAEIQEHLKINSSALYTLKSRLYDKIQNKIAGSDDLTEDELLKQVNEIHSICYNNSREIAIAFLTKLEDNLKKHDMSGELLVVYSALKQLHLFSEKYFQYSQIYNRQIACYLTTEKSIEILGNFNKILMQYDFSKSAADLETLLFLHKGILEQYSLNSSRQIEVVKNIMEVELCLFTGAEKMKAEVSIADHLKKTAELIDKLPAYSEQKQWMPVINFLNFEFYVGKGDFKTAAGYYEMLDSLEETISQFSNNFMITRFLISKFSFLRQSSPATLPFVPLFDESKMDEKNTHLLVMASIHNSMVHFYQGKNKESVGILNNLLNNISVKDLHFININLKLSLAYLYLKRKDFSLAENTLKSLMRKIKSDNLDQFNYVNNLIKLLLGETNPKGRKTAEEGSDLLVLFESKNSQNGVFSHFLPELKNQYLQGHGVKS